MSTSIQWEIRAVGFGARFGLRHLCWLVPVGWYCRWPLSVIWYATHGAQWGWEIEQDYERVREMPTP